jgi:hypothetical protein
MTTPAPASWHACSECKSRRKTCNEDNPCCDWCRTTGGWTHIRNPIRPAPTTRVAPVRAQLAARRDEEQP